MIFLTLGTCPQQFDRLLKGVDEAVHQGAIEETIFAQTGSSRYTPKYIEFSAMLEKGDFDETFDKASCVIGHAGMGTISMALAKKKPLLVMARMARYGEHVNDHQVSTAEMFERLGHVLVAHSVEELPEKLKELKTFVPADREASPRLVAERVGAFLTTLLH